MHVPGPPASDSRAPGRAACDDGTVTPYTAAQAEAIACLDEPLQIIACAGSGKTQVISQRIAAILARPGCTRATSLLSPSPRGRRRS